jgi:hypothetical protein
MPRKKKLQVKVNNQDSLEGLLQETYNDACKNINEAQSVINEISNSTEPVDVDDYSKIAKNKVDALKVKEGSIKIKLEISKIQKDILKSSGEVTEVVDEKTNAKVSLDDFKAIRDMIEKGAKKKD